MPDATVEPRTTVLLRGTQPNYTTGRAMGTTGKMGLIMIPSTGTYDNGWTLCTTIAYGGSTTDLNKQKIGIRELDMINPQTTIPYDKAAETIQGDNVNIQILIIKDAHWALLGSNVDAGDIVYTHDDGSLQKAVDGGTDSAVHTWNAITSGLDTEYIKVRYAGVAYRTHE